MKQAHVLLWVTLLIIAVFWICTASIIFAHESVITDRQAKCYQKTKNKKCWGIE